MSLEAGELVGYIGPNGAGKSTTIKMLTGILVPDVGRRSASPGIVPYERRSENARNIGVVFGQRSQLYWDLPLVESFELLRAIYDVPRDALPARTSDHFIELLEMDDFLATPVRQLSLGQRMRGDFAAAMLHDPKVVFLDEPTIGLDVVAKEAIRDVHRRHQPRARDDLHPHDPRPGRRRAPVPAHRADRPRHADLRRRRSRRLRDEYGTHRTLVVELCEPEQHVEIEGAEAEVRRRRRSRASASTAARCRPKR